MKIIIDIPDPEKAEAFLQHFVPNLSFIATAEPASWIKVDADPFEVASIQLREGVTKEQVFQEQGKKGINFREVQELVGTPQEDEPSLEELLALLD